MLKTARIMFIKKKLVQVCTNQELFNNPKLYILDNIDAATRARIIFVTGPAIATKTISRRGFFRRWNLTGIGFAQPNIKGLLMTIRSDYEYRESTQKGKLGAYTMLKLLYRG